MKIKIYKGTNLNNFVEADVQTVKVALAEAGDTQDVVSIATLDGSVVELSKSEAKRLTKEVKDLSYILGNG